MLDAIDADDTLRMIDPIKNTVVSDAELAQSRQVIGHPDQAAMHGSSRVFRQPYNLALNAGADGGIQRRELSIGLRAYFDAVGHET